MPDEQTENHLGKTLQELLGDKVKGSGLTELHFSLIAHAVDPGEHPAYRSYNNDAMLLLNIFNNDNAKFIRFMTAKREGQGDFQGKDITEDRELSDRIYKLIIEAINILAEIDKLHQSKKAV